jgi:hypothetical protein
MFGVSRLTVDHDNPNSISARSRARRWDLFVAAFPDIEDRRVLDLGGTPQFWRNSPVRPVHVTTVNLAAAEAGEDWIEHVVANACDFEPAGTFDIAFSNSLIEHVGGHYRRAQLAEVIRRAAPRYWVQTPYRYFPVEPHYVFPLMQFLPVGARTAIAERWHAGPRRVSRAEATEHIEWLDLIGIRQMRNYFPEADIAIERFSGLPKSIVAIAR